MIYYGRDQTPCASPQTDDEFQNGAGADLSVRAGQRSDLLDRVLVFLGPLYVFGDAVRTGMFSHRRGRIGLSLFADQKGRAKIERISAGQAVLFFRIFRGNGMKRDDR